MNRNLLLPLAACLCLAGGLLLLDSTSSADPVIVAQLQPVLTGPHAAVDARMYADALSGFADLLEADGKLASPKYTTPVQIDQALREIGTATDRAKRGDYPGLSSVMAGLFVTDKAETLSAAQRAWFVARLRSVAASMRAIR